MQANNGSIIATIIVCAALILASVFYLNSQIPEVPEIPTADEIAALIVMPEVVIPDMPITALSLREDLKQSAIELCNDEFDMDEVEDLFGDDDEVTLVKEYDNRDFYHINLGIDNEDDRTITVDRTYKFEIEPDLADDYKDKVYVTCKVTSDDGELEADLVYNL